MPLIGGSVNEKTDYILARNKILPIFRQKIYERLELYPFEHQAAWQLLTDGKILTSEIAAENDPSSIIIRLEDKTLQRRKIIARPDGIARFVSDLGSFKIGKSLGSAIWMSSFAIVPTARVVLVGLEYDTCAPEFEYLSEILLSARGFNLKPTTYQNRPRDGKMWIDLDNGVRYEARSWERKESLKGKEVDAYVYAEAYQLPGLECLTSVKQNLDARRGFAVFPTTPDKPWVVTLHQLGHDPSEPDWDCICGIPRSANPFTYDPDAEKRDQKIMTRERYGIHYRGQIGEFVGSVFGYQQGQRRFTTISHPFLWKDPFGGETRENCVIPSNWEVVGATDSGTFYSTLIVAFDPEGNAYVLDEFTNYRYTAMQIEIDDKTSIPSWARRVRQGLARWKCPSTLLTDRQNQMKQELRRYGLHLRSIKDTRETRVEIAREYFQHGRIFFAPWLEILPVEIEKAAWPDDFDRNRVERRRRDDHTLDCLEHILSQRPQGDAVREKGQFRRRFIDEQLALIRQGRSRRPFEEKTDPHGLI